MRQIKGSLFLWVPIIVIGLYYLFTTAYTGWIAPKNTSTSIQTVCLFISAFTLIIYILFEIWYVVSYIKDEVIYIPLILTTIVAASISR